ncbi:MAG: sensor histidine kinase, partial [Pseudonocardia sp.]
VAVGAQIPQLLAGGDPTLPAPVVAAVRPDLVAAANGVQSAAGLVVLVTSAVVLVSRLRAADRAQRRTLAAVCGYGTFTILFLVASANLAPALGLGPIGLFAAQLAVVAGVPFAFLAGVMRGGFARTGEIGELGAWLGTGDGGRPHLREALGSTLGDPSLELLFWLPELQTHVDAAGTPVALPRPGSGRAAVEVVLGGETVGAIAYDATLHADPEIVRAAGRVVALAIERERLTVQLLAGREALRESRARIVTSADRERRRIARDLHDGLQARLVVLALQAGRIATDRATPAGVRSDLATLGEDLEGAIAELRGLVHGIMPALLLERGLVAAIEDLTLRAPLRTHLDLPEVGFTLPRPVEHTGYFVVAEALTNVVKHACATVVRVRVARRDGILHLEVGDDGVGGARPGGGSGLRGIADRVDVLGGRLAVDSRPGEGTRLVVELPCGS